MLSTCVIRSRYLSTRVIRSRVIYGCVNGSHAGANGSRFARGHDGRGRHTTGKEAEGQQELPQRCEIETGRNTIKYQARVSYKPGGKTVQRSAGSFDTPEEAALQITDSYLRGDELAEGIDPWDGAQIRFQHKRGQVCAPFS